ncbi:biotin--[acetyl-CoA-carboxylase] ligase [Haliangium sp.]|uniref:biotin--[acetyl-CoA-carboxylase] ligase n=1 Tax=Haliangium sp. TaxID=2663208 RepID=UPI003D1301E4
MSTGWLGRERVHLATCGSTNDEAARLAAAGAEHGLVVTADAQRAGRGRRGRTWHSPPGESLYLSCVLRPALTPARAVAVTLAAGLGVWEAVHQAGAESTLKWPNDVLVGGRKLAGVLTEMSTVGGRLRHIVIGIGINLANRAFPPELAEIATSLALAGHPVERDAFVTSLLGALERWFDRFFVGGVRALADTWLARADRGRIRASAGAETVEGTVLGLADDGCLLIEDDAGAVHRILAGEVTVVAAPAPG